MKIDKLATRQDFEMIVEEVEMNVEMTQKIKAQETFGRKNRWQVMHGYFNIGNFLAKRPNFRDRYKRYQFNTARCSYFSFMNREWFASDIEEDVRMQHSITGSCIQNHTDSVCFLCTNDFCGDKKDRCFGVKFKDWHGVRKRLQYLRANPQNKESLCDPYVDLRSCKFRLDLGYGQAESRSKEWLLFHPSHRQQSKATRDETVSEYRLFFVTSCPTYNTSDCGKARL